MNTAPEIPQVPNLMAGGLHLQLPLGIPDYHRRSKIKPQPIRPMMYFEEELRAMPVNSPVIGRNSRQCLD